MGSLSRKNKLYDRSSQDLFFVNNAALLAASINRRGWWVYLAIPAYLLYLLAGYLWSWFDKSYDTPKQDQPVDPKEAKRLEKLKKKEEKPKVKYVKA